MRVPSRSGSIDKANGAIAFARSFVNHDERSKPRASSSPPGPIPDRLMARAPRKQQDARLATVTLDESSIGRGNRYVEHERAVAIYDLLTDNTFKLVGEEGGPYALQLGISGNRLVFDTRRADGTPVVAHMLSLAPFRRVVKDYFTVCDSYYAAIRTATPDRIEALYMGRRALHDEGSRVVMERLKRKVELDFDTARRLFTLLTVLHWKG